MDEYRSKGIERRSGFATGKGPFGPNVVVAHSWRRGQDRGKRRVTWGVYGTKSQIRKAFSDGYPRPAHFTWTKFRNGKFMVW